MALPRGSRAVAACSRISCGSLTRCVSQAVERTDSGVAKARGPVSIRVPAGDSRPRAVCDDCGYVAYRNPLIVCGCIASTKDGRVLLARRAIEPRKGEESFANAAVHTRYTSHVDAGHWALPAGYMECSESVSAAAARELFEETDTRVLPRTLRLAAVYTVPHISQVHMWFMGEIDEQYAAPTSSKTHETFFGRGEESLEVALFEQHAIPWSELAFESGVRALRHYYSAARPAYTSGAAVPVDVHDIIVVK